MRSQHSLVEHLVFPFQLLRAGSGQMLILVLIVAAVSVVITDFLQIQIARSLVRLQETENYSKEVLSNLFIFGQIMSWVVMVPVLIAAQALPVRIIFLHDKMPFFEFFKYSIQALKLSFRGLFYALRWSPIYLVPLIAVMLLERILAEYLVIPHYRYTYYTTTAVIGIGVAYKILPYLLIPWTSVLSLSEPHHAHYKIAQIFDRNTAHLMLLAFIAVSGNILLVHLLPALQHFIYIGIFLLYWYYITLLFSGYITRELAQLEVEAYQMQHGRHQ